MTEKEKEYIKSNSGFRSAGFMARKIGVTTSTIINFQKKNNLPRWAKSWTKENEHILLEQLASGKSRQDAAEFFGVTTKDISQRLYMIRARGVDQHTESVILASATKGRSKRSVLRRANSIRPSIL